MTGTKNSGRTGLTKLSDVSQPRVGVLLAGGRSRRAGVDKRFLVLEGRTLLRRNLAFLRTLFPTTLVSLAEGEDLDLGDTGDVDVVHDAWPDSSPLVGIATALGHVRRPVFVMAVDLAFPDPAAARRVLAAFPGHDVALPMIGPHHEPLFAAYGPACLAPMTALLEAGRHKLVDVLSHVDAALVPFIDDSAFRNINTMADCEAAREQAARGRAAGGDAERPAAAPALVAIVGKHDSGKTTFIEKLIPELLRLGLRVGAVKHDAHDFEIDHPGKDSWRHGQAGALTYVVSSPQQLAYISKLDREMPLAEIARRYFAGFDLVVAEGYKRSCPHLIELFRLGAAHDAPLCAPGEALALVTDAPLDHLHRFELDDAAGLARFLVTRLDSLREY